MGPRPEEITIEGRDPFVTKDRVTIQTLLTSSGTLDQYEILQRADVRFAGAAGRYYAGPLSPEDVEYLTPKKPVRH